LAYGLESHYDRVAVISEDAAYLTLIARLLELHGLHAETYQQPDVALTAIRQERPNLIVLDCDVVGANGGGRMLDILTLDPATSAIPVIVCATDVETLQDAEQWLGDHGIIILPKPFNPDDLSLAVQAAVDLAYGGQHKPFAVRAYRGDS
jgi:DNA-binding response OmpR family regulator